MERRSRYPWLLVATSFVWFAVGGAMGLLLPSFQASSAPSLMRPYTVLLTGHGVAMTFGGLFQLMAGLSLARAGACAGGRRWGALAPLLYGSLNGGMALLAVADLLGFAPSYVLMYPLPVVAVTKGLWSEGGLILGFVGVALLLVALLLAYPAVLARAMWGRLLPSLGDLRRLLQDPGMLGMSAYFFLMPLLGLPVLVFAGAVFLAVLGLVNLETVGFASRPLNFNIAFWLFAHNLMEAMGIMALASLYSLVPLYTRSPVPRLFSPRMGVVAVLIYSVSAITAFGHHLYTMVSTQPVVLTYNAQAMSWLTGWAAGLTAFNIGATLWRDGLRPSPAVLFLLGGFGLYLADGLVALQLSTRPWNLTLHGTLYVTAHTMTILKAVLLVWLGVLYHHLPDLVGRSLEERLGYLHAGLSLVGALGTFYAFLWAGAEGIPRRAFPWPAGGQAIAWPLLAFGLFFAVGQAVLLANLAFRWRTAPTPRAVPASHS